jgi:urease accessory protein
MADGAPVWPSPSSAGLGPFSAELAIWLSPSFPTGGFAYSHGLERLAQVGTVHDLATLADLLEDLATLGALHNDLILLATAWRAVSTNETRALDDVARLAAALQPSQERRTESLAQGAAFAAAIGSAWSSPAVQHLVAVHADAIAYPIAVGTAAADRRIDLPASLLAYGIAFSNNLISAAIRLSIVGQVDGQRALARILPTLHGAATKAATATLDDLGGASFANDIASMEHETQYTRLFRT